ncbi:MAG: hypothetical protein AB8B65_11240 [Kordia sp.]|uniref:hypothetical protein n=1 Tax=Kordia sp. TaxID=1965332 RepID=UPI0038593850
MLLIAQLIVTISIAQTFTVNGFDYKISTTNPNEVVTPAASFTLQNVVVQTGYLLNLSTFQQKEQSLETQLL